MTIDPLEINGTEPRIAGHLVQELVAIEYSHAGTVADPANVVFLRFAEQWHRLYFDCGIVFWRTCEVGPQGFTAEEIDATYRPVDLAAKFDLRSRCLLRIHYAVVPDGTTVRLKFDGQREITFSSIKDVTTYA